MFKSIIPEIVRYNPKTLLIVSNPVDVLTYVSLKISEYPMNRIIGSGTVLDTARFRYLLSRHCKVDPRNVHAYIIGEHGDSEVPVWSQVNIGGVSFRQYCPVCKRNCREDEREEIFDQDGISKILKIGLDESEINKLRHSADVLKNVIKGLDI